MVQSSRVSLASQPETMEDSAYPFPAGQAPAADCVLLYGGGDTPHTWTPSDIAEQRARFHLPGFVRSDPQSASYIQDANAFTSWLQQVGAPVGCTCFLDLETAVAPGYVSAFGHIMNLEGYKLLPYGSLGYVWQNPHLDGLFVAHPDGAPHLCTPGRCGYGLNGNAVITQYLNTPTYDLSLIAPGVPLWDTQETDMPLTAADIPILQDALKSFFAPPNEGWGRLVAGGNESEKETQAQLIAAVVAALAPVLNALPAAIARAVAAELPKLSLAGVTGTLTFT